MKVRLKAPEATNGARGNANCGGPQPHFKSHILNSRYEELVLEVIADVRYNRVKGN
jgi:hypothetical protein